MLMVNIKNPKKLVNLDNIRYSSSIDNNCMRINSYEYITESK